MRNIERTLAWKYLTFSGKDKSISFMIKICFAGIAIGTFALMMTLAITNGFEKTIHEKMQGINADIVMYAPGSRLDYTGIQQALRNNFTNDITGISGSSVKQAIIDHKKSQTVIFIKGINPTHEKMVTNIHQKITIPKQSLQKLLQPKTIIIGHKTAEHLGLCVNQKITILIPEPGGKKRISLRKEQVTIGGIFTIGLEEYDSNFAFAQLDYANQLFEVKGVDTIALKLASASPPTLSQLWQQHNQHISLCFMANCIKTILKRIKHLFIPNKQHAHTLQKLKKEFPELTIQPWQELYPALVSSLKLEKYAMFFIIALVTLVAAMNMISLLFMQVQHKRRDIAIYKAMGMQSSQIQSIFIRIGIIITMTASLFGLICAGIAGYILERYPFIQLPDVYYVSHLPARLEPELFIVVFITTLIIGVIATWLPARQARFVRIVQVLRQE